METDRQQQREALARCAKQREQMDAAQFMIVARGFTVEQAYAVIRETDGEVLI